MISFKKLLSRQAISFLAAVLIWGCAEKQPEVKYAAKVGDEVLTEDEVDKALSSRRFSQNYRNEFIRNWIETELLYLEAKKQGVLDSEKFRDILAENSKQLASAFLLSDFYYSEEPKISSEELEKFYNDFRPDFALTDDASVVNIIKFNNYDKAVFFRNRLIDSDWKTASELLFNDSSVVLSETGLFSFDRNFSPPEVVKIIKGIIPGEASIIFEEEPGRFLIVQLTQKFQKGEIPAFEFVKDLAEERYLQMKRKSIYGNLIKDLYSKYDVEITTEHK